MHQCFPTTRRNAIPFLALSAILTVAGGCGSSTDVTGKVTYKGAPLSIGSVTLVASNGTVYSGNLNSDGSFSIPGVPTGEVQIAVVGASPGGGNKPPPVGRGQPGGPAGVGRGGSNPENPEAIAPAPKATGPVLPAEYADPRSSGLTAKIKAGEPLNIDLK